jgi:hypothetical protein
MVGCATNWPQQFDKKLAMLDEKGLVLATVTFSNQLDNTDSILPEVFLISKDGHEEIQKYRFTGLQHLRALNAARSAYLIVLDVKRNDYFFYSIRGKVLGDIFQIFFEAPILLDFTAKDKEILYIGNIHLVLRKKVSESELRPGPVLPLLQQAVIADATFDVEIRDRYEIDLMHFEQVFPNIKGQTVVKRIFLHGRGLLPKSSIQRIHHSFFSNSFLQFNLS